MIEILLQAENALSLGLLDQAERLYWQVVDADPGNAIAIVGLGRVAHERGDERTALAFGRKALEVDSDNAMARRLVDRLEEIIRYRGETVPGTVPGAVTPGPTVATGAITVPPAPVTDLAPPSRGDPAPAPGPKPPAAATPPEVEPSAHEPATPPPGGHPAPGKRGRIGRLFGRS